MKDYRFFKRNCFLIGKTELLIVLKELFEDNSLSFMRNVTLMAGEEPFELYSSEKDTYIEREQILSKLSDYLNTQIIHAYILHEANEVYLISTN